MVRGGMGRGGTRKGSWGPGADVRHGLRETRSVWTGLDTNENVLAWFIREGARQMSRIIHKPEESCEKTRRLVSEYQASPLQFYKLIDKVNGDEGRHAEWA